MQPEPSSSSASSAPLPLPSQPIPEACVERASSNWTIFGFGDWFPSLITNDNDKRVIGHSNGHQYRTDECPLTSHQFIRGQLVNRTSIWELELGIKGGNVTVALGCLHCFHNEVEEIWAHFDVDIIDLDGTVLHSEERGSYFDASNLTKFSPRDKLADKQKARLTNRHSFWETNVISKIELSKNWSRLVYRNILNLRLKFHLYHEKPIDQSYRIVAGVKSSANSTAQIIKTSSEFLSAVKNLWETMEDSDVKINIDGNILTAHKFVLGVQCPVLKEMIKTRENLAEDTGKKYTVLDLSGHSLQAFKLLLKYFYTQDPQELRASQDVDFISSVLQTCKQFEVQSLASICLVRLLGSMTVENFGGTASAIFQHGWIEHQFFRREVKRFLIENQPAIQGSEEFKNFAKIHPDQFLQICLEPIEQIWLTNNMPASATGTQTN